MSIGTSFWFSSSCIRLYGGDGGGRVIRRSEVDRILKDIQNLECEGKSLVLKTEESATKPKELIVEFLTGKI